MKLKSVVRRFALAGSLSMAALVLGGCDGGESGEVANAEQAAPSLRENLEASTRAAAEDASAPREHGAKDKDKAEATP